MKLRAKKEGINKDKETTTAGLRPLARLRPLAMMARLRPLAMMARLHSPAGLRPLAMMEGCAL